jgi:adenosylcobinamide kinase / adenosylcobinamide-phosphate guanylyltransferase
VITLVLGGTRSGKSELAERIATSWQRPVTYVATGQVTDSSMASRIARHRARRPASWSTVEAGVDLPGVVASLPGPALIDSLGTWVAGCPDLSPDGAALCRALAARSADSVDTVLVSEEVGLGVHPVTEVGRRFADTLGELNQAVAAVADEVLLAVAGRALRLPGLPGPPGLPGLP